MVICIPTSLAMQHDSLALSADEHGSSAILRRSDSTSSVLQGVMPRFLHRRLSSLRSFKDIAATYTGHPSRHQRHSSVFGSNGQISPPPPPYSENPLSSSDEDDMNMEFASAPSTRPSSSTSAELALACDVNVKDLVRFKFANQGLLLVAQSAQELRTNPNPDDGYQRRLYLDGVAYLLRALPEKLTETERAGLQAAMPEDMRDSDIAQDEDTAQPQEKRRQSTLSVTVSVLVFWSFFALATALPYMKLLARWSLEFERRHKLGEQCLSRTLGLLQITYAQLIAVLCAVWAYNDGIVGQKLTAFGVWCAENVGDGVRDGLREAAATLRRTQDDK